MSETTEKPTTAPTDPNEQQGPRRERPDSDVAPYPETPETPETPSTPKPASTPKKP